MFEQVTFTPNQTTVCVLGLGYIGLPTASLLATKGFQVVGVDVREDIVEQLSQGQIHIREPDLDMLVRSAIGSGQLRVQLTPEPADVFIICVPTPLGEGNSPDMSHVAAACSAIRPHVRPGNLVILESTSPPGTTSELVAAATVPDDLIVGENVFIAHCPERVLPGRILIEAIENDRVIGGVTPACALRARQFYLQFVHGEVLTTTAATAEFTKLCENAYRDVNIALANEISLLATKMGVDPWDVIELANRHPRVNILSPGPGVGGHCISVDPWFLVHAAPQLTPLMRTAREVNNAMPQQIVARVVELARRFRDPTIGCLGLTYKADVDDLRQSPALEIVRDLGAFDVGRLLVCDPLVNSNDFTEFPLAGVEQTVAESDVLVLLTDHRAFRELPRRLLAEKVLVDTRGVWR